LGSFLQDFWRAIFPSIQEFCSKFEKSFCVKKIYLLFVLKCWKNQRKESLTEMGFDFYFNIYLVFFLSVFFAIFLSKHFVFSHLSYHI